MFEPGKIICMIVRQGELRQWKIDIAGPEKIGKAVS